MQFLGEAQGRGGFNRNIVECKSLKGARGGAESPDLIET